jgi:hypothetical protein
MCAQAETVKPGAISVFAAAPPMADAASSTSTCRPAFAR